MKELYLINSYKVEKSYWSSPVLKEMNRYLKEGLSQAKDTVIPKVHCRNLFRPFVEDELSNIIAGHKAFVAHPYAKTTLQRHPLQAQSGEATVVLVGPEGGFTDFEIELARTAGAEAFSMSERIYRVENAITLVCANFIMK